LGCFWESDGAGTHGNRKWEITASRRKKQGVFLDGVYAERSYSNVLKFNRKIYGIQLDKPSTILNQLKESNHDTTLVSYYENEAHYKSHKDYSVLTAMTYLYKQPKAFEGGDLDLDRVWLCV
jgi:Rps23 Pro-64 3,4-dihydroxylase Tpa1-like proline 4-hydroxylase